MPNTTLKDFDELNQMDWDKCPVHNEEAGLDIDYQDGMVIPYECGCAVCFCYSQVFEDSVTYHSNLAQAQGRAALHDQTVKARGY